MGTHRHGSAAPPARLIRLPKIALLAALSLALGATNSDAQPGMPCAPRSHVLLQLEKELGETPVAMGIAQNGHAIIEVFASEGGGELHPHLLAAERPGLPARRRHGLAVRVHA